MKNLKLGLLLAASVFLIDTTPALAHDAGYKAQRHTQEYRLEDRRRDHMPRWLKRDRRFREWYRHTPLKRYRFIGWHQLYDIYRWERSYFVHRRHRHNLY